MTTAPALPSLSTTGPVLFPGDPDYSTEISPWVVSTAHTPDVVVGAACAEDVLAAVRYARLHSLPVAVQATGHGAATPVTGGVLVTTRRMNQVCIDPVRQTARFGAGTKW